MRVAQQDPFVCTSLKMKRRTGDEGESTTRGWCPEKKGVGKGVEKKRGKLIDGLDEKRPGDSNSKRERWWPVGGIKLALKKK